MGSSDGRDRGRGFWVKPNLSLLALEQSEEMGAKELGSVQMPL